VGDIFLHGLNSSGVASSALPRHGPPRNDIDLFLFGLSAKKDKENRHCEVAGADG
jgi:hypothetical protein